MLAPTADAVLARDLKLLVAFQAKLAADPGFAADPDARIAWVIEQAGGRDPFHWTYPVRREP